MCLNFANDPCFKRGKAHGDIKRLTSNLSILRVIEINAVTPLSGETQSEGLPPCEASLFV